MNLSKDNSIYPLVIYKGWQCLVRPVLYPDGNPGLVLEDIDDGSPVATCTVNLPTQRTKIINYLSGEDGCLETYPQDANQHLFVFIKDYSENEGMLKLLVTEGIIDFPYYDKNGIPLEVYGMRGLTRIPFLYVCHASLIQAFNQLYDELYLVHTIGGKVVGETT